MYLIKCFAPDGKNIFSIQKDGRSFLPWKLVERVKRVWERERVLWVVIPDWSRTALITDRPSEPGRSNRIEAKVSQAKLFLQRTWKKARKENVNVKKLSFPIDVFIEYWMRKWGYKKREEWIEIWLIRSNERGSEREKREASSLIGLKMSSGCIFNWRRQQNRSVLFDFQNELWSVFFAAAALLRGLLICSQSGATGKEFKGGNNRRRRRFFQRFYYIESVHTYIHTYIYTETRSKAAKRTNNEFWFCPLLPQFMYICIHTHIENPFLFNQLTKSRRRRRVFSFSPPLISWWSQSRKSTACIL